MKFDFLPVETVLLNLRKQSGHLRWPGAVVPPPRRPTEGGLAVSEKNQSDFVTKIIALGRLLDVRQTVKEMDVIAQFDAKDFGIVDAQLYQVGGGHNGMG